MPERHLDRQIEDQHQKQLIRQFQQGNPEALDQLCEDIRPRLVAYFSIRIDDPDLTQDLTQIALIKVANRVSTYEIKGTLFSAYYFTAAYHVYINYLRSLNGNHTLPLNDTSSYPNPEPTPEQQLIDKQQAETFNQAFSRLSPARQQVITLHYVEGLSHQQVGKFMNTTEGGSKSLRWRATQQLRAALNDDPASP